MQNITVSNTGGLPVGIQSVTATAGFTVLNACGSTLTPGSTCTIGISYTPASQGSQTGTLTITDNAPGSPHTVSLSGSDTALTLGAASGGSTAATITAGQTATYHLLATPVAGFTGALATSCTGAPAGMQCTATPSTLSITGGTPVDVTFTVAPTTTAHALPLSYRLSGAAALALLFGAFGGSFRRKGSQMGRLTLALVACLGLLGGTGCGGGSSMTPPPSTTPPVTTPPVTTPTGTTYVLNAVLTTSSGQQIQQPLALTVNNASQ